MTGLDSSQWGWELGRMISIFKLSTTPPSRVEFSLRVLPTTNNPGIEYWMRVIIEGSMTHDVHEKPRSEGKMLYGWWDGQLTFEFIVTDTNQTCTLNILCLTPFFYLRVTFTGGLNQLSEERSIYIFIVIKVKLNLLFSHCDETPIK